MVAQLNRCNVVVIDNYDSFTFNLVEVLQRFGCQTEVWRNDISVEIALSRLDNLSTPTMLVISPGPGAPAEAGHCLELIQKAAGRVPVVGVCLGHQAIVEAMGGKVGRADKIVHGKTSQMTHSGKDVFAGISSPMTIGRYHSLAAIDLPPDLVETGTAEGITMAVEHRYFPMQGLQFHPESILTPRGDKLIHNLIDWAVNWFSVEGKSRPLDEVGYGSAY